MLAAPERGTTPKDSFRQGAISMLMFKERPPAIRTLRGWAISVLQEAGAIPCSRRRSDRYLCGGRRRCRPTFLRGRSAVGTTPRSSLADGQQTSPRLARFFSSPELWEAKPVSLPHRAFERRRRSGPSGLGRRAGDDQTPERAPKHCWEPRFLRRERPCPSRPADPTFSPPSSSCSSVLAPSPAR